MTEFNTISNSLFLETQKECPNLAICRHLLEFGADPNYLTSGGASAFHIVCGKSEEDIVKLFLEYEADPNNRSSDGLTALHSAFLNNRCEIYKLLLQYGGDPTLSDDDGFSPVYNSGQHECRACFKHTQHWLLKQDLVVNSTGCHLFPTLCNSSLDLKNKSSSSCDISNSGSCSKTQQDLDRFLSHCLLAPQNHSFASSAGESAGSESFHTCPEDNPEEVVHQNNVHQSRHQEESCHCVDHSDISEKLSRLALRDASSDSFPVDSGHPLVQELSDNDAPTEMLSLSKYSTQSSVNSQHTCVSIETIEILDADSDFVTDNPACPLVKTSFHGVRSPCLSLSSSLLTDDSDKDSRSLESCEPAVCSKKPARFTLSSEEFSLVNDDIDLSRITDDELRARFLAFGTRIGPLNNFTRPVYLKKLSSLNQDPPFAVNKKSSVNSYPRELKQAFSGDLSFDKLSVLEQNLASEFSNDYDTRGRPWREGSCRSSFIYLLLDSRITQNLPQRFKSLGDQSAFKCFIESIFYVGKGKGGRPYAHFKEALKAKQSLMPSEKVRRIIEIWESGVGVVSLQLFQSVRPVEAYTREACIIAAIGIKQLTNVKRGDFYGALDRWSPNKQRLLGTKLLYKAFRIFLLEGERHIQPTDF